MANPKRRKRSRSRSVARRSHRRVRRNPFSGGASITSFAKGLFSKELLKMSAGAVGASALTSFVITKWGPWTQNATTGAWQLKPATEFKLPFLANEIGKPNHYGRAAYSIAISAAGAFVIQKFDKDIARGAIVSGLVMAANEIVAAFSESKTTVSSTAGASEYFPRNAGARPQLRYGMTQNKGVSGAGYDAIRAFGASPMTQSSAFNNNAFHN